MSVKYLKTNELMHYGVKGMRWGVRRYQPYKNGVSNIRRNVKKTKDGVIEQSYRITDSKNNKIAEAKTYDFGIKGFDWILMADVETNPNYRGKSLATQLVNRAYDDVKRNKGLYLLVKQDNENAINLYKKTKFDLVKEYNIGEKSYYVMAKGDFDKEQLKRMNFS